MNTYQALSIATCACSSLACNQPANLNEADLIQASVILAQMGATLQPVGQDNHNSLADLSNREVEVLQLFVAGYTIKGVAQELVISTNTVKIHLRNIIEKLGVQNRAQAIALAAGAGLGR